jgi:hypothetical protein
MFLPHQRPFREGQTFRQALPLSQNVAQAALITNVQGVTVTSVACFVTSGAQQCHETLTERPAGPSTGGLFHQVGCWSDEGRSPDSVTRPTRGNKQPHPGSRFVQSIFRLLHDEAIVIGRDQLWFCQSAARFSTPLTEFDLRISARPALHLSIKLSLPLMYGNAHFPAQPERQIRSTGSDASLILLANSENESFSSKLRRSDIWRMSLLRSLENYRATCSINITRLWRSRTWEFASSIEFGEASVSCCKLLGWRLYRLALRFSSLRRSFRRPRPLPFLSVRFPIMTQNANQHDIPHEGGWAAKDEGNSRSTSVHSTRQAAIDAAREVGRNQGGEILINGRNCRICERDSG